MAKDDKDHGIYESQAEKEQAAFNRRRRDAELAAQHEKLKARLAEDLKRRAAEAKAREAQDRKDTK